MHQPVMHACRMMPAAWTTYVCSAPALTLATTRLSLWLSLSRPGCHVSDDSITEGITQPS